LTHVRRLFLLVVLAVCALGSGTARAAASVSSNWSGYAVSGASFSSVSGGWTQPAATCASGSSSAAFWVGLGGNSDTSQALEQIGTSSDCSANGTASYSAWYELVPASSVPIKLKIAAGNKVWASVKVNGTNVTLTFKNLTRNTSFTKTLTMAAPDVSSAEWIAEAPSACDTYGRCRQVTLTNFGKIAFAQALATARGHTGSVTDQLWTATPIELQSFANFGPFASASSSAQAVPAGLAPNGSSFTVTYSELDAPAQPSPFAGPSAGF
jgi:Peptidase A4 family